MILFYLILFCIPLYRLQFAGKDFQQDYLSVQQTNVIKGIFIWLVFFSHITPYITQLSPFTSPLDTSVFTVQKLLGQLIVVPFLFYSGYGVMLSIMKKPAYLTSIPKKRIPVTFLNFAVAVLFFVALNLTLDISMTPKQILLSLLMWDSVGNSNWYIFTICFCYFASYVAFSICKTPRKGLKLLTLILLVFAVGMSFVKEGWWYDTCMAYAAGSYFACYKERMEGLLRRHYAACITIFGGGNFSVPHIKGLHSRRSEISGYERMQRFLRLICRVGLFQGQIEQQVVGMVRQASFPAIYLPAHSHAVVGNGHGRQSGCRV